MYIYIVVTVVLLLPIVINIVRVSVAGALDDDSARLAFSSETHCTYKLYIIYIYLYIVYDIVGVTSTIYSAAFVLLGFFFIEKQAICESA